MMAKNMRCSPEHVRRLHGLGCPVAEIGRISGYTKEQLEAIIRVDRPRRPRSLAEQEAEWTADNGWSGKQ